MSRQHWSDGQEITEEDLNDVSIRLERQFYRFMFHVLNKQENAFFPDSFVVSKTSGDDYSITVSGGIGVQKTEADFLPIHGTEQEQRVQINANQQRKDIVIVRSVIIDEDRGVRSFKNLNTDLLEDRNLLIAETWGNMLSVVAGVESASPFPPATPNGWVEIAELTVNPQGHADGSGVVDIVDTRNIFPVSKTTVATGSLAYDAIIDDEGGGVTHGLLQEALENAKEGDRILVKNIQVATQLSPIIIDKNNITLEFKTGAQVVKGNYPGENAYGIIVRANDVTIINPWCVSFDGVNDGAIHVEDGSLRTVIRSLRIRDCRTSVIDNNDEAFVDVVLTEG